MAEKSLFFNALPNSAYATGYDRNFNADDVSDWLSAIVETGVVKHTTGLKVSAVSGLTINAAVGKAVVKGKPYYNTTAKAFTLATAPVGDINRIDAVVLRYDNTTSERKITLELKQGALNNTIPALTRNDLIYELLIAYITVAPNTTALTGSMITDFRGDITTLVNVKASDDSTIITQELNGCPYVTAVKGYDDYYDAVVLRSHWDTTLAAAGTTVTFDIATYNSLSDIIEVYANGFLEDPAAYTITNRTITFTSAKLAGTKIEVIVDKFIDGEGLPTALENYTRLNNIVESLQDVNEYNYVCNGVNDNVMISNIVKDYLNGRNYYDGFKLNVYGTFGANDPARGAGTSLNPYGLFDFVGSNANTKRSITVDFSNCTEIAPSFNAGVYHVIFYGANMTIKGANVNVAQTGSGTVIRGFYSNSGALQCDDCRFFIMGYQDSLISSNGTFNNCLCKVANVTNNSYCFIPAGTGLLRITNGEYYAYVGGSTNSSAIVGVSSAGCAAVLNNVNAPTVALNGYRQTNSLLQWSGSGPITCVGLISALPMITTGGTNANVYGTLALSKPMHTN